MEPSNFPNGAPQFDGRKAETAADQLPPSPSSAPITSQSSASTSQTRGRETATATMQATKALPSTPPGTPYPVAPIPKRPLNEFCSSRWGWERSP